MNQDFPFKSRLSLSNIIGYWELRKHDENKTISAFAESLISEIDKHPELRQEITDMSVLDKHAEIVELLMSAVFPVALREDTISAAFKPFTMDYFYGTKKFHEVVNQAGCIANMVSEMDLQEMLRTKMLAAYQAVLAQFYQIELPGFKTFPLSVKDEQGLSKYYRLVLNPKFCEIQLTGSLPQFSNQELLEITHNLGNLEYLQEKIPPQLFEFVGFGIYQMQDATVEEVLSAIKETLLKKDSIILHQSFEDIEDNFRSLIGIPGIKIGLNAYQKSRKSFYKVGDQNCGTLMTGGHADYMEPFHNVNQKILRTGEPYIVADTLRDPYFEGYRNLISSEIRNILFIPLHIDKELIGILEIGSTEPGALNTMTLSVISEITSLFAIALKRSAEELDNRIQSIIKEYYTSIHPVVEWKFTQSAYKILEQAERKEKIKPEQIVFNNVYPLYAASDVRNSSLERNQAIVSDLTTQLKLAKKVFAEAKAEDSFPLIGEMTFKINKAVTRLKKGLISGDETTLVHFINAEVEPLIRTLEIEYEHVKPHAESYWSALDKDFNLIYDKRKDFESSLTKINEVISGLLDTEQEKAQKIFPHYFEKYKTDGVEYNAYIGASLSQEKKFNDQHLRNLRLWQLITTVEIARHTAMLKNDLAVPLDTTHLILVHNQPLSVKFRMDEKQFDVDGAYNMRYEIVKKRIDKVHIKDTDERLTQPNKIAVVFSTSDDAREYKGYFKYLQHKGLIGSQVEELDLEELQGVSGLKALRVSVEPGAQSFMSELESLKSELAQ